MIRNVQVIELSGLISHEVLTNSLRKYKRINDKISDLIEKGKLIKIQKGKYVAVPQGDDSRIDTFAIANALYGPSYITAYTALSFHGLIPERVNAIENATTIRSKVFNTQIGKYVYRKMPIDSFHLGINYVSNDLDSFMIANPTKALVDALWWDKRPEIHGIAGMKEFLLENMRIEEEALYSIDAPLVLNCMEKGKRKKMLKFLYQLLIRDYNGHA